MFLKKIELQGFKSFPNKVIFEVNSGITGIVGPNGSGKSNIVDAIRWVLGEQSMKTLRGSKGEDVIFNGTEARKPLGFAEISLVVDNSLGMLPVNYTEVVVTRRIYRSGESEFYINKNACRLKDINELFMGTGVGRDGYSIIGQGRIDEILSNKAEERRMLFEEATGIMKYRIRKNESEKKLEDTMANLLRINDITSELETQIVPLEEQSKKAKTYLELKEQLKGLDIYLFVQNINRYKEKASEVQINIENVLVQIGQTENKFEGKKATKQSEQQKMNDLQEQIDKDNLEIADTVNQIEKGNSEINITLEKINNNKSNFERLDLEIMQYEEKNSTMKLDTEGKRNKLETLLVEKQRFETDLKEKENILLKIGADIESDETEINTLQSKIDTIESQTTELKTLNNNSEIIIQTNEVRKNKISSEISQLIVNKDIHNIKNDESKANIRKLNEQILEQTNKIANFSNKKQTLETKMKDLKTNSDMILQELNVKKSKYKFLSDLETQYEGYSKSVKSILEIGKSKQLSGIHGALAELLTVPKKYEQAIETALGFALQNIVTDDEDTAKNAINYLKKHNLGRATFLPITTIINKQASFNEGGLKKHTGYIGIASQLVSYDDKYKNIVESLLSKTLIVDNLETGIQISKEFKYGIKIVTLDGDIINPSGSMTGGSVSTKNTGILSRSREITEIKSEIKELEQNYNNIQKDLSPIIEEYNKSDETFTELNNELQELQILLIKEQEQTTNLKNIIEMLEQNILTLKQELELITTNTQNLKDEIVINNTKIIELENSLKSEENSFGELEFRFKDKYSEKSRIYEDITNIKISLTSIEEGILSVNEVMEMMKSNIDETEQNIEKRKIGKDKIIEENDVLTRKIEDTKLKIQNLKSSIEDKQNVLIELKKQKESINQGITNLEEEIMAEFKNIEVLKTESTRLEFKKSKFENDIEELKNKMWDDYEITLNKALEYKTEHVDVTKAQKECNVLRDQIRSLGSINIDAIDEYAKVKERYEFLSKQKNDLEESEAKLRKVIAEMLITMKEQFEEKFSEISKNFEKTFKELFNGGKANLKLSDESNILESYIEIEVQPPGKKLQNLMSLSGGERAFTAIALLFAIFKMNPSPFCVLDEIEAALDEANVFKFADYIKNFSSETQFLIITHRKGTMEIADTLYGVTMEEKGVSKLVSMKLGK